MWKVIDRPGYLGTSRDEIHSNWNKEFGKGNWRISWEWGNKIIEKRDALQIYEDGYYEFFKSNLLELNWLTTHASDIYDTAPTNIQSGLDYSIQETSGTHLHDIAIRRAVLRNGVWFKGDHLIHVRPEKEGERFGPHLIPFHLPGMIYTGKIKYKGKERDFVVNPPWWTTMGILNSVEQFYQQNKVLEIKE